MNVPTTLLALHERLAAEFVSSAVIVDDQALPRKGAVEDQREHVDQQQGEDGSSIEVTGDDSHQPPAARGADGVTGQLVTPGVDEGKPHDLDAHEVIESFARAGIACAVLSPQKDETVEQTLETLLPVAARSDLLITDWVQHNDNGQKTQRLIAGLLAQDTPPRQRVIAVYTGQTDLGEVLEHLKTIVGGSGDGNMTVDDDKLSVEKGSVRAVVIGKPHEPVPPGQPDRRVGYADLPRRLCEEFARATLGLVAGAALAALTAVRADTHRVLSRLDASLDAGYVGHRLAQRIPTDAEEHLTRLILAELATVLTEHDIGATADAEAALLWLDHIADPQPPQADRRFGGLFPKGPALTIADMALLLGRGLGDRDAIAAAELADSANAAKLTPAVRKNPTRLVVADLAEATRADLAFSALMNLQTAYRAPDRSLRLGTIVETTDGGLLLCVQPVCDAVRIQTPRTFPFAPLTAVTAGKSADLVVHDSTGTELRVKFHDKPHMLVTHRFAPAPEETVQPAAGSAQPTYEALPAKTPTDDQPAGDGSLQDPGATMTWVGQLRPEHAQKLALRIGQQFSRLGVDESEFLRLNP